MSNDKEKFTKDVLHYLNQISGGLLLIWLTIVVYVIFHW